MYAKLQIFVHLALCNYDVLNDLSEVNALLTGCLIKDKG